MWWFVSPGKINWREILQCPGPHQGCKFVEFALRVYGSMLQTCFGPVQQHDNGHGIQAHPPPPAQRNVHPTPEGRPRAPLSRERRVDLSQNSLSLSFVRVVGRGSSPTSLSLSLCLSLCHCKSLSKRRTAAMELNFVSLFAFLCLAETRTSSEEHDDQHWID